MSRSGGELPRRPGAGTVLALAALLAAVAATIAVPAPLPAVSPAAGAFPLAAGASGPAAAVTAPAAAAPAAAQASASPAGPALELPPGILQSLALVPQLWNQWLRAFYQDQPEGVEKAVSDLLVTARQLGIQRLPDLSLAAAARAVQAARENETARARRALSAAERLDPGRPEIAFAAAEVERREGRHLAAVAATVRGYARLFAAPDLRRLALQGAGRFALCALLAAGALFLALQMATKGSALLADLARLLGGTLPRLLVYPAVAAVLLWPLALPSGPLWLAAYWTVLLWGYGSASERTALIAVWLIAGAVPPVLALQRPRLALELSPPVRAMAGLAGQRLYGDLFTDLAALPSLFPDSTAVRQLTADVHRRLGDWAGARRLYQEVHEAEPENPDALIGLGGYYFYQGDYGTAVRYFRRAVAADPGNAAAYFDLSQAFSQQYHFGESSAALAQARALAADEVGAWIAHAGTDRLQVPEGGLARVGELRGQLLAVEQGRGSATRRMAEARRWAALLAAAGVALAALALHLVRRPFGYGGPGPGPGRGTERWLRALIPGYGAAADGRGVLALAALVPLAALLLLPLAPKVGHPLPVVFSPGPAPLAVAAAAALALVYLLRLWRELRAA